MHYFGHWIAGFKNSYISLHKPPKFTELINSSGGMKNTNNILVFYGRYLIITLFFVFQITTILTFVYSIYRKKIPECLCFILICQIYLIAVSLINISTLRYLMPVYPLVILSLILFFHQIVKKNELFARS